MYQLLFRIIGPINRSDGIQIALIFKICYTVVLQML